MALGKRLPKISTLEPMVLFSATPIDPAMMDASAGEGAANATVMEIPLDSEAESQQSTTASSVQNPDQQSASVASEIIIIDALTPDLEALLEDLRLHREGSEVIVLDANRDGVTQITEILESRTNVRALQIISHSEDASVRLGNLWLGAENLDAYAGDIASWQHALTSDADILFYGCDLATDANGRTLVDSIAALTGADVAASDDDTGHARYGADWDLEYATGVIDADIVVSASFQETWGHKLATITVTTWLDESNNNGETSLREAITQANAGAGGDTIVFSASLDTPTVFRLTRQQTEDDANSYGDFDILKDVTIVGHGMNITIIDAGDLSRIFDVHGGTLTLSDVTLQGGNASGDMGGAIRVEAPSAGLNLQRALLTSNTATEGGAIGSKGTIELTDVAIIGNGGVNGYATNTGGGITNRGAATLNRVTLSGNVATVGGAIFVESSATSLSLTNVTVSGNTGANAGGGLYTKVNAEIIHSTFTLNTSNIGGGIFVEAGTTTVANSIVSGNTATSSNPDVHGTFASNGGNLIGNVGSVTDFSGDLIGANVDLGALANNGGYVQTHKLQSSSAAIDAGKPEDEVGEDARGYRSLDGRLDSGSYQAEAGVIDRIFWIDSGTDEIRSSNLDGTDVQTVRSGLSNPDELFVDSVNQHIYFSEPGSDRIRRVNFDGTGLVNVLTGLDEPRGMAIDLANDKIYWIEDGDAYNAVKRSDLDGGNKETLALVTAALNATKPDAIVLDLVNGHVYWADELTKKVERMDLDGANRTTLFTQPGFGNFVNGLALDIANNTLYYTVSGGDREIWRADLDGTNRNALIDSGLDAPDGLAIDHLNGKLYWTEPGSSDISMADLDGSNVTSLGIAGLDTPKGIGLGALQNNDAPISLGFQPTEIVENTNTASGLSVGTLSAFDIDEDETFTYTVTGGADAAKFTIEGGNSDELILTDGVLDYENQSSYTVVVNVEDSAGNNTTQTITIRVANQAEIDGLWFTTDNDVSESGVAGLTNWGEDQVIQISDPGLTLDGNGGTTSGTASTVGFRLENFISDTNVGISGMHAVWSGLSVGSGANSFELLAGDLIFSIDKSGIDFSSETEPDKEFDREDVIVFRASTPGDYSSGDFFFLLDDPLDGDDIRGISLVESEGGVTVGDTTLAQGTFLFSHSGGSEHDRVITYHADTVGESNTSGTETVLIEGSDGGNLGFTEKIVGLHLVESSTTIGGVAVTAGDLLISVHAGGEASTTIGGVTGTNQDVFRLTMTSTRIGGSNSVANVELLFDGSDVGLDQFDDQEINSLTFAVGTSPNTPIGAISDADADPDSVDEDAEIGDAVGIQAFATDSDGEAVTYSLISDPDSKFAIDSNTGIVTLAATLDYDTATEHSFTVRATSADSSFTDEMFTVQVIEANETPSLTVTSVLGSIAENADLTGGVHVANVTLTDDGIGTNTYSLTGDDANLFELRDSDTKLYLKDGVSLDFDTNSVLDVTVSVDDNTVGGTPDDSASFSMTVTDVNTAPVVSLSQSGASLAESTATGSRIKMADINVTDDGTGTNVLSLSGDDANLFEIVGTELFWKGDAPLDFETQPSLDVTVNVDDSTLGSGIDSSTDFTLTVTDVNEAPSVSLANIVTTISEGQDLSSGMKVADIVVDDDDLGLETYSLSGDDSALFRIDGTEVWLIDNATLDFDTNSVLDVTVSVDDNTVGGTPDDSASFSMTVTDVNSAPVVSLSQSGTSLAESTATGSRIKMADINVTDDGTGTNVLSLSGDDANLFEIVGTELFWKGDAPLDFETQPSLDVTVNVDDSTLGSGIDSSTDFTLTVTDVNEAPSVSLANIVTTISEGQDLSSGMKVADIVVDDDNLGLETYSLSGDDSALFRIDGTEVWLINNATLDFDTNSVLDVTVSVDDNTVGGTPDDSASFSMTVTDVNTAPVVSLSQSGTSLAESTATGSRIKMADINVTDDGTGTNVLSLSGDDANLFEIVGTELFWKGDAPLDFETQPSLDVTVNVDDSTLGSGIDSSTDFTLTVTDVNEAPSFSIVDPITLVAEDEDLSGGLKVADLDVTDDLLGAETFSLSGDDAALFEVIGNELWLRAGITLDAITNPNLDVTIDLDDASLGGSSEDTKSLQIQVTTTNTPPTLGDWQDNSLAGQTVTVPASVFDGLSDDVDGQILTAHLSAGPLVGNLNLQADGSFIFTPPPGFIGSISFEWTAFDGRQHSAAATVTLTFLPVPVVPTPPTPTPPEDTSGSDSDATDGDSKDSNSDSDSGDNSEDSSNDSDSESANEGDSAEVLVGMPNAATTNPDGNAQQSGQSGGAEEASTELERMNASVNEARLAQEAAERELQIERNQLGLTQAGGRVQRLDLDFDFGSDGVAMTSIDYALMTQPGEMWDQLDSYQQRVNSQINGDLIVVGTAGAAASSVTVGVVAWALRSGLLLSGLIAHMPAWSAVDPLLIMQGFSGNGDGETLEELMDRHDKAMTDE
ncbi:protein containing Cadherin domain protein [Rhodopirellula baltica SWK14]|uniref:Protein containing Cadherin domain protein n=1 Tax=Rhodopirellula baltica SWK14 TaxID=993516 RepID=L7CGP8_RHOBT|nr:protein containing Cadherin domain protein [Rhodopirellula baltica SWK14]